MRRALLPLVPLYAAAVATKNSAYAAGWIRARHLRAPVISIGNLSVGGSGKTPLTIRVAQLIRERGLAVDVLSRGYGRQSTQVARVDPGGSWQQFGDEPLLIAQRAEIPVYVGASRYAAGVLAESQSPAPGLHLLDDGFQHRRLARVVDIVVVHRSDFAQTLLPAGRLREPFSSLKRADILVLRRDDNDLEPDLRARGLHQPIWWMARHLQIPAVSNAIAFCAIARPDEFLAGLAAVPVLASHTGRDHQPWSDADVTGLLKLQRQHNAAAFLTTEKDMVRLAPEQRSRLEHAAPLHAVRLDARLDDEPACIDQLLRLAGVTHRQ